MYKNIILITIVMLLTITSQTFLKKGLKMIGELKVGNFNDLGAVILKLIQNKFIIAGILVVACGAFLWLMIISRLDLTTVFPIAGGIFYILLFLSSWIFFGEAITLSKIIGVAAILAGMFLILR